MNVREPSRTATGSARPARLDAERTVFVLVSFEGTDRYSQAGGLGVRVTGLADSLSQSGHETHLFFIGDPQLPGEERRGRLTLHRWSQWISAQRPGGVYDDEAAKVADLTSSLPPFVIDRIIAPAIEQGRTPVVIFEEWQTAECACLLSERLSELRLRDETQLIWNANNPYGFERIDWQRLSNAVTIATVSRYMRSIIRSCGANAVVMPNGIPTSALAPVGASDLERLRAAGRWRHGSTFFLKMARWEREKGWMQALDAIRILRDESNADRRIHPILLGRAGGPNGSCTELTRAAEARGLRVVSFDSERAFMIGLGNAVREGVNVISLQFGVSPRLARLLFAFADAVFANSVSEPFGLVGLEAMAASGLVFTGGTGEDYAVDGSNAVVLETLDPKEIAVRWRQLADAPALQQRLRRSGRRTARKYLWPIVVDRILETIRSQMIGGQWNAEPLIRRERQVALHLTSERRIPDRPVRSRGSALRSYELRQDDHESASGTPRGSVVAAITP